MMESKKGIQYRLEGQEGLPVILFSNSLGTDISMWDQQVEELKSKYRILRYNTKAVGAKSIADLGNNVIELMDELNFSQVHFCGISLGGLTGIWLARYQSQRFHSLTLANTSARIATPEVWQARIELVKSSGLKPVAEGSAARWFTADFIKNNQEAVEKALKPFSKTSPEAYINFCEILKSTDLWSTLSEISVPVLIIGGEFDQVTTAAEAKKMADLIHGSKLEILLAAHLSNIEAKNFTSTLRKIIERNQVG
ncbi:MAG: alpha/beta hydrolase [Bacteriovoracaceae bacterium]|nr:alpha/beta hydrolase [Bacteriovoracaceae bacterium]